MRVSKIPEILCTLPSQRNHPQSETVTHSHSNLQKKFKILEKEFLKKATLRQLIQKQQNSSLASKRLKTIQKSEISSSYGYLGTIKKAHDDMVKKTTLRKNATNELRKQINKIRKNLQTDNREIQSQREYLETLLQKYKSIKEKEQLCEMTGKNLFHILSRMKKDEVLNQKRIDDMQVVIRSLKCSIKEAETKKLELNEFQSISSQIAKEMKKAYSYYNNKRKKEAEQYQRQTQQINDNSKICEERQRITDQIQAIAASDLNDATMIKWKKLLYSQLLLKKILKFKISNIQIKYGKVKNAFHTIKSKTVVDDNTQITLGYHKLRSTYDHLLENARYLEQKQKKLLLEKKKLEQEYQEETNTFYEIIQPKSTSDKDQEDLLWRKAKDLSQECLQIDILQEKIYNWWFQKISKFNQVQQKPVVSHKALRQQYPIQKLGGYLVNFCRQLVQKSESLGKQANAAGLGDLRSLQNVVFQDIIKSQQSWEIETEHQKKTRWRL